MILQAKVVFAFEVFDTVFGLDAEALGLVEGEGRVFSVDIKTKAAASGGGSAGFGDVEQVFADSFAPVVGVNGQIQQVVGGVGHGGLNPA